MPNISSLIVGGIIRGGGIGGGGVDVVAALPDVSEAADDLIYIVEPTDTMYYLGSNTIAAVAYSLTHSEITVPSGYTWQGAHATDPDVTVASYFYSTQSGFFRTKEAGAVDDFVTDTDLVTAAVASGYTWLGVSSTAPTSADQAFYFDDSDNRFYSKTAGNDASTVTTSTFAPQGVTTQIGDWLGAFDNDTDATADTNYDVTHRQTYYQVQFNNFRQHSPNSATWFTVSSSVVTGAGQYRLLNPDAVDTEAELIAELDTTYNSARSYIYYDAADAELKDLDTYTRGDIWVVTTFQDVVDDSDAVYLGQFGLTGTTAIDTSAEVLAWFQDNPPDSSVTYGYHNSDTGEIQTSVFTEGVPWEDSTLQAASGNANAVWLGDTVVEDDDVDQYFDDNGYDSAIPYYFRVASSNEVHEVTAWTAGVEEHEVDAFISLLTSVTPSGVTQATIDSRITTLVQSFARSSTELIPEDRIDIDAMVWRGLYSSTATYGLGDIVFTNIAIYVCRVASVTGTDPDTAESTTWGRISVPAVISESESLTTGSSAGRLISGERLVNAISMLSLTGTELTSTVTTQDELDAVETDNRVAFVFVTADFGSYSNGDVLLYDSENTSWITLTTTSGGSGISLPASASETEAKDGTLTDLRLFSPLRVHEGAEFAVDVIDAGEGLEDPDEDGADDLKIAVTNDGLYSVIVTQHQSTAGTGTWADYTESHFQGEHREDPTGSYSANDTYFNTTHKTWHIYTALFGGILEWISGGAPSDWRGSFKSRDDALARISGNGTAFTGTEIEVLSSFVAGTDGHTDRRWHLTGVLAVSDGNDYVESGEVNSDGDELTLTLRLGGTVTIDLSNIMATASNVQTSATDVTSSTELSAITTAGTVAIARVTTAFSTYSVDDVLFYDHDDDAWEVIFSASGGSGFSGVSATDVADQDELDAITVSDTTAFARVTAAFGDYSVDDVLIYDSGDSAWELLVSPANEIFWSSTILLDHVATESELTTGSTQKFTFVTSGSDHFLRFGNLTDANQSLIESLLAGGRVGIFDGTDEIAIAEIEVMFDATNGLEVMVDSAPTLDPTVFYRLRFTQARPGTDADNSGKADTDLQNIDDDLTESEKETVHDRLGTEDVSIFPHKFDRVYDDTPPRTQTNQVNIEFDSDDLYDMSISEHTDMPDDFLLNIILHIPIRLVSGDTVWSGFVRENDAVDETTTSLKLDLPDRTGTFTDGDTIEISFGVATSNAAFEEVPALTPTQLSDATSEDEGTLSGETFDSAYRSKSPFVHSFDIRYVSSNLGESGDRWITAQNALETAYLIGMDPPDAELDVMLGLGIGDQIQVRTTAGLFVNSFTLTFDGQTESDGYISSIQGQWLITPTNFIDDTTYRLLITHVPSLGDFADTDAIESEVSERLPFTHMFNLLYLSTEPGNVSARWVTSTDVNNNETISIRAIDSQVEFVGTLAIDDQIQVRNSDNTYNNTFTLTSGAGNADSQLNYSGITGVWAETLDLDNNTTYQLHFSRAPDHVGQAELEDKLDTDLGNAESFIDIDDRQRFQVRAGLPIQIDADSLTGNINAMVFEIEGFPGDYEVGQVLSFTPDFNVSVNTGPVTIEVNSNGVTALLKSDGTQFAAGELSNGVPMVASYTDVDATFRTDVHPSIIDRLATAPDDVSVLPDDFRAIHDEDTVTGVFMRSEEDNPYFEITPQSL